MPGRAETANVSKPDFVAFLLKSGCARSPAKKTATFPAAACLTKYEGAFGRIAGFAAALRRGPHEYFSYDMNEVIKNILSRRSVRSFEDRQIPSRDLMAILDCARRAPSGMNAQGCHFCVVQKKESLSALLSAAKEAFLASGDAFYASEAADPSFNFFYAAPTFVIVSANPTSPDIVAPEADAACALQNIFLAAHSLGISSCWIHALVPFCSSPALRPVLTSLGVPPENMVYGGAALGYCSGAYPEPPEITGNAVSFA